MSFSSSCISASTNIFASNGCISSIPGSPDSADLEYNKAFINELKNGGYDRVLSVESSFFDFYTDAAKALDYLKKLI